MNALAQGLYEGTDFDYLEARIKQVEYLGQLLKDNGIPLQNPFGGHAIFVNAREFLPHLPKEEFVAQTLAIELYIESGVRGVEIGTLLADRDPETRENRSRKSNPFYDAALPQWLPYLTRDCCCFCQSKFLSDHTNAGIFLLFSFGPLNKIRAAKIGITIGIKTPLL